ncbi:MAG: hypothetical protein J6J13_03265 [Clostridia bacterium]|nr:hypothetical protein [Clostridia bacterium]
MTALKIVNKALALLGYSDSNNNMDLTRRVLNRALPLTNLVYSDMCRICETKFSEIETLNDEISLPDKAYDIMACGLASYIAGAESDDFLQSLWSAEYQQRRTTLSRLTEYEDVLPTPED